jgi:hypothetical protein
MSLGGHIVGLANKKENDNNNDVEQSVASIDATLGPSEVRVDCKHDTENSRAKLIEISGY